MSLDRTPGPGQRNLGPVVRPLGERVPQTRYAGGVPCTPLVAECHPRHDEYQRLRALRDLLDRAVVEAERTGGHCVDEELWCELLVAAGAAWKVLPAHRRPGATQPPP